MVMLLLLLRTFAVDSIVPVGAVRCIGPACNLYVLLIYHQPEHNN